MVELSEGGGTPSRPGPGTGRRSDLEAENLHLRALLAEREQDVDRLRAAALVDAQIRTVADALPVLISYVDAGQRYRYNNKAYESWFACRRGLLYGLTMAEALGEEAYGVLRPFVEAALAGERVGGEVPLAYPDGVARHIQLEYVPSHGTAGSIAGFYSLVRDISESKRVEVALRESEARFRSMADSAPSPVWVTGEQGVEFVNRTLAEFAGCPPEQLLGLGWTSLIHPDDLAMIVESRKAAWAGEAVDTFDARFRRHDGEWRWFHASVKPRFDADGRRLGFVGMAADITDAKRAETELRESEARFRAMADCAPSPVWVTNADGIEFVNQAYVEAAGRSAEEVIGGFWMKMIHPDDLPITLAKRAEAWETGTAYGYEARFQRADGEWRWMDVSCRPRFDVAGTLVGYVGLAVDVTEQKRAEAELRESEARFRLMADSAPAPVWVTDESGIEFANRGLAEFTGLSVEALRGETWMRLAHPDDIEEVLRRRDHAWQEQSAYAFEARFRRHDGEWRWLRCTCKPRESEDGFRGYVGLAIDITEARQAEQELRDLNASLEARIEAAISERERVEEALRQAQKMEAVGQLTGGIAHDFNNLLTVIGGNLDLAARRLGASADPRVVAAIASAMNGADRAATLTQRLLAFSRRQPLAPKPTDPNALLAGMSDLLHRTLGERVEVETRLAAGLARIEVDPHQLESAILNLAVNGRDAMPDGGRLVIETGAARVHDGEKGADGEPIAPGAYIRLSVADTGSGMNDETLRRAVEPFFTTKEVGKGTGLGLSMVYGFVRQSGGQLRIESTEGRGTAVHIYLPRLGAEFLEEGQVEAAPAPRGAGDEVILVCEDDEDVRAYTVELLAELGYRVVEAEDGATTLRWLEDPATRIDLLFTDVVLPGAMSGADLAAAARALRPGLKVLYTTGYARDAIVHEGRLDAGIELIAKPFAFAELAVRVRALLDRG